MLDQIGVLVGMCPASEFSICGFFQILLGACYRLPYIVLSLVAFRLDNNSEAIAYYLPYIKFSLSFQ